METFVLLKIFKKVGYKYRKLLYVIKIQFKQFLISSGKTFNIMDFDKTFCITLSLLILIIQLCLFGAER